MNKIEPKGAIFPTLPAQIQHSYEDYSEFTACGDLFGIRIQERTEIYNGNKVGNLIGIYIDDDGCSSLEIVIDEFWIQDLKDVLDKAKHRQIV